MKTSAFEGTSVFQKQNKAIKSKYCVLSENSEIKSIIIKDKEK